MKKIALLPIDNRPVTYTLLKDIMALNDNIKLDIPERNYLGGLYEAANIKEITISRKYKKNLTDKFCIF